MVKMDLQIIISVNDFQYFLSSYKHIPMFSMKNKICVNVEYSVTHGIKIFHVLLTKIVGFGILWTGNLVPRIRPKVVCSVPSTEKRSGKLWRPCKS